MLQLSPDGEQVRRYFEPDLEALLLDPPPRSRGVEMEGDYN
jgi:hypothetical protein